MAYYLIDFENVHDTGLVGVSALSSNDEVCIFYSVKSEHMTFDTHVNIMKSPAKVKYIMLRRAAKNYLDFQLVTHLGYLVGSNAPGPYYIISKDTGYDSAIDYWRDHGVNIIRQPSISYNRSQGRFPGQQSGQVTPAAIVTVQESHKVISENTSVVLANMPENVAIAPIYSFRKSQNVRTADNKPVINNDTAVQTDDPELPFSSIEESDISGRNNEIISNVPEAADNPDKSGPVITETDETSSITVPDSLKDEPVSQSTPDENASDIKKPSRQSRRRNTSAQRRSKKNQDSPSPTKPDIIDGSTVQPAAPSNADEVISGPSQDNSPDENSLTNTDTDTKTADFALSSNDDAATENPAVSGSDNGINVIDTEPCAVDRPYDSISNDKEFAASESNSEKNSEQDITEPAASEASHDSGSDNSVTGPAPLSESVQPADTESGTANEKTADVQRSRRSSRHKNSQRKKQAVSADESEAQTQPASQNTDDAGNTRTADTLNETYRKRVRTALHGKEIPFAHYSTIYKAIVNSYDKLALNNLMVKTFGSSKGGVVYNQIKDIFTDYHQQ